jgi:NTE family protein
LGRRLHGNPALYPLVSSRTPDILVVQINPMVRHDLPKSAREIINRVNEVSFNSSLIKELRAIAIVQRDRAKQGPRPRAYSGPSCT